MSASFSLLDLGLLLVFSISLFLGLMKGLVRELFSLGFLILGVALGYRLSLPLAGALAKLIHEPVLARFAAFVIVLGAVLLLGIWTTWLVKKVFIRGTLSFMDRVLGGILGACRGLLFCTVVVLAFIRIPQGQQLVQRSLFPPFFLSALHAATRVLPEGLADRLERYLEHAKQENRRNRGTI